MKKLIILSLAFMLVFGISGIGIAGTTVTTGLTKNIGGGTAPEVLVKWEADMNSRYTDYSGDAGAQFMPSGENGVNKRISICAIVMDPEDGLADVKNVYADVFYPEKIALGDSHIALTDQSGDGCGALMQEDTLVRQSKTNGFNLFCDKVRNLNPNLPEFKNQTEIYDTICKSDGYLMKDEAAVYCGDKYISYEDPSGNYKVWAVAVDQAGNQDILENYFTYLPLTAFETDFTSIAYGDVRLDTEKIISGDLTWDESTPGKASVRNVGNTRLMMAVSQNDMELGKTSGNWNVSYKARVGSLAPYASYLPDESPTSLNFDLDLSELDEMDFAITISKFPPDHGGDIYTGTMTLSATQVDHLDDCTK